MGFFEFATFVVIGGEKFALDIDLDALKRVDGAETHFRVLGLEVYDPECQGYD